MRIHIPKWFLITILVAPLGCGGDDGDDSTTDGADGSGDSTASEGESGSAGEGGSEAGSENGDGDGDGNGDGDGDGDGDGACGGMHPEVEDDQRFCLEGWCGCGLGVRGYDLCYPEEEAEACCPDEAELQCPAPKCEGMHPEVEGDNRFCLEGWCGCGLGVQGYDLCFPQDIAQPCCDGDVELECF